MENKGFTLLELMGVIALLGIIALIAIPAIDETLNNSKDKLSKTQENQIIKGAKDYFVEHPNELPCNDEEHDVDNSCSLMVQKTIKELQDGGYLPLDIVDPKKSELYSPASYVEVEKKSNKYTYKFIIRELETDTNSETSLEENGGLG